MVSSKAAHPNLHVQVDGLDPLPRRSTHRWPNTSARPRRPKLRVLTRRQNFCATYHATDAAYAKQISYWTTPPEKCVDGSRQPHGLQRVGRQVAADQGVTQAGPPSARPALLVPPADVAGRRVPARSGTAGFGLLGHRHLLPAGGADRSPATTSWVLTDAVFRRPRCHAGIAGGHRDPAWLAVPLAFCMAKVASPRVRFWRWWSR